MKTSREEYSYRVDGVRGSIERRGSDPYDYHEGLVRTPQGYVRVYSEPRNSYAKRGFTMLNAIVDGREYTLRIDRQLTHRGAATAAGRWIRELQARHV